MGTTNGAYLKKTSSFLPISDLQTELARKGHETQEEQKRMTELVEKLQSQLSQNECDLKSRETQLRRQQVESSRMPIRYLGEFRSIEYRFAVHNS